MEIFKYSGPSFDLYGEEWSDSLILDEGPWPAPVADEPLTAQVAVPGSKSITNRELVLSALADSPSTLRRPLHARDTALMVDALAALGTEIEELETESSPFGADLRITPADELEGGVSIECGLAGTVMRFVPPVAALALGPVNFDGDESARKRPMSGILEGLERLGVEVRDDGTRRLPFSLYGAGKVDGGELEIDAAASSQFVSGLLLAAPRFTNGLTLTHTGDSVPSLPHIEMTLACLRARGVTVSSPAPMTWRVEPGAIAGAELTIEPDLTNAAPFLLAAVVAGGEVRIPDWPTASPQLGDLLVELLERLGAAVAVEAGELVCRVERGLIDENPTVADSLSHDFSDAGGELVPNLAAVCALLPGVSTLSGIGHLRGHETDRVAALASELRGVGCEVEEGDDQLVITGGGALTGGQWHCYEDHRMATTGAILGLAVEGIELDDVRTTSKTLPQFPAMWGAMLAGTAPGGEQEPPTSFISLPL